MKTNAIVRDYLPDRAFIKGALAIMIPIIIQQIINTLFNMVDTIMVGQLNEIALTAVSVANKPYNIYAGFFFGISGGSSILISQYFGAGDKRTCQQIFSVQMLLGLFISLVFCALLFFIPMQLMSIFSGDDATIALGIDYMRVVCFSYIPAAVSTVCIFSLRAIGRNRVPMVISIATMLVNAACNYVLIFGKLGIEPMGVAGGALGTLIARLVEMCLYLSMLARKRAFFTLNIIAAFKMKIEVLKSFIGRVFPLTVNELMFAFGNIIFFWAYMRVDEVSIPALNIADIAYQVSMVLMMGLGSAVGVMVGASLGANDFDGAKRNAKSLLTVVLIISGVCMAIGGVAAHVLPYAFASSISESLRALATRLTLIYVVVLPFSMLYLYSFYLLRAGGEAMATLVLDSVFMYLFPIPVCVGMALFAGDRVDLFTMVLIVQAIQVLRLIPAFFYISRGRWLRNITITE